MKLYKSLISVLFSAVLLLSASNSFAIDKLHFVIGGGAQWRPFVHVCDTARAFMHLIDQEPFDED